MRHAAQLCGLAMVLGWALSINAQVVEEDVKPPMTLEERIQELENQLDVLRDSINEPEGSIQATITEFTKVKKIAFSGYLQARYENDESSVEGTNNKNNFDVRRARLKVAAKPTDNTMAVIQVDAAGSSVTAKDAYIAYTFGIGDPYASMSITAGQYLLPFGYQVLQSSSSRETPETATVIRKLFPSDYDRGVKVSSSLSARLLWEVGVFNGTGANVKDNNNNKDLVGRVRYSVNPEFNVGLSGYSGVATAVSSATPPVVTETVKTRYGLDAQYYLHNTTLKAEYITGQDMGKHKFGWYAQVAHNVTQRDTAVVMYDQFQDTTASVQAATGSGKVSALNIGWIRSLDEATRLKFFYEINSEENKSVGNDNYRVELITVF